MSKDPREKARACGQLENAPGSGKIAIAFDAPERRRAPVEFPGRRALR